MMTRLLVSVKNALEVASLSAESIDVIDVKEPDRGPLGPANRDQICEIIDACQAAYRGDGSRPKISVAGGELSSPAAWWSDLPEEVDFAKLGLSGCRDLPWQQILLERWSELPAETEPVPVCYWDDQAAQSPSATAIVEFACQHDCRFVLFDTFDKRGPCCDKWLAKPTLQSHWQQCFDALRGANREIVLAGRLACATIPRIVQRWEPDMIGVRGAVCDGSRQGSIVPSRVRQISQLLRSDDGRQVE